jgi:hypothetical protein
MQYTPIEIWSADWHIKTEVGTFTFLEQSTRKMPISALMNDTSFMARIRNKLPSEKKRDAKLKKEFEMTIKYNKKIGIVNQLIEDDPWN